MSPTPVSGSSSAANASKPGAAAPQIDKNMFLQLMVAQLRNQDPLSPTDSMQFVQQLAQYQQLEQSVNTGQDISAIRQNVEELLAAASTGSVSQS